MNRIGVLTSGGDAPGMNACIRAIVKTCAKNNVECIGIFEGYNGLVEGFLSPLTVESTKGIEKLGGTILKTARSEEFKTDQGRAKAFETIREYELDALIVIGGDGSFKGAQALMHEFDLPVIGIPGTIDNDLYGTDYTLGFDTAVNNAMQAIDKIMDTAEAHNRLFLVEVMGRDSGHIALNSAVACGADVVFLPEVDGELKQFFALLKQRSKEPVAHALIAVVAEGDSEGNAFKIANRVRTLFPEFDTRVTVLGHTQRGGSPTQRDRVIGARWGVLAVESLLNKKYGYYTAFAKGKHILVSLDKAANHKYSMDKDLLHAVNILTE